jgi:hypothetical protein
MSATLLRTALTNLIAAGFALLALLAPAAAQAVTGKKEGAAEPAPPLREITPEQFDKLHQLIKPHKGESQFMEIPWVATVGEARKKAAAEGKPLFIWYMVGEPLGQC